VGGEANCGLRPNSPPVPMEITRLFRGRLLWEEGAGGLLLGIQYLAGGPGSGKLIGKQGRVIRYQRTCAARRQRQMDTAEIVGKLRDLTVKKGWSIGLGQSGHVRFKTPEDKPVTRNPLAALALDLHGKTNPRWAAAGAALGLDEDQIQDFTLACETRWFRPLLRREILNACGFKDKKFEAALALLENLVGKTRLERVLDDLFSKERIALEAATDRGDQSQVEEIFSRYLRDREAGVKQSRR